MSGEFYWGSGSAYSWCVMLALELKGITYRSNLVEMTSGETRSPEFLAMNPRGQVPVYKDGDAVVYESVAILAYLDRAHPEPALFGSTPQQSGLVWTAVFELVNYLYPPAYEVVLPVFVGRTEEHAGAIQAAIPKVHRELAGIDQRLQGRDYMLGSDICAADVMLYPMLQVFLRAAGKETAESFNIGILPLAERYHYLSDWCKRIESLPFYDKTYPPHWRE